MNDELNKSWDKFYSCDEEFYAIRARENTRHWVRGMVFGVASGFVITCALVALWGWLFLVPGY